jgi:hypothetical protein
MLGIICGTIAEVKVILQHNMPIYLWIEHLIDLHDVFYFLEHPFHELQLKGLHVGIIVLRFNLIHGWRMWKRKRDCIWLERIIANHFRRHILASVTRLKLKLLFSTVGSLSYFNSLRFFFY